MRVPSALIVLAFLASGSLSAPLSSGLLRRELTPQEHQDVRTLQAWFNKYNAGEIMSTPELAAENQAKLQGLLNKFFDEYARGEFMATPELTQNYGELYTQSVPNDATALKKWAKLFESGIIPATRGAASANYQKLSELLTEWFHEYENGGLITYPELEQENRQALLTANVEMHRQLWESYKSSEGTSDNVIQDTRNSLKEALHQWLAVHPQFNGVEELAEEYKALYNELSQ
ncbi:hypothetical protein FRC03_002037 [Tulasnella sp. 419]|nr:hypothetical protein FRC03_002037 [Tulasnella sp. 419]